MAARTKQELQTATAQDRAWDALEYGYDRKRENTQKQYDQAVSSIDRQALGRGMQRSSYNAQTQANMMKEGAKALGDIDSEQAAAYAQQLYQIDRDAAQDQLAREQMATQLQAAQISANASKYSADINRDLAMAQLASEEARYYKGLEHQTSERRETQEYNTGERRETQEYQTGEREATQGYQTGEREASQAYQSGENTAQRGWQSEENEKNRVYESNEKALDRALTANENALNRGEQRYEHDTTLQERKDEAAWQQQKDKDASALAWQQFGYQGQRDTIEDAFREKQFEEEKRQAMASEAAPFVQWALENSKNVTPEMLARIGMTPQDWAAMFEDLAGDEGGGYVPESSSGSGRRNNKTTTPKPDFGADSGSKPPTFSASTLGVTAGAVGGGSSKNVNKDDWFKTLGKG